MCLEIEEIASNYACTIMVSYGDIYLGHRESSRLLKYFALQLKYKLEKYPRKLDRFSQTLNAIWWYHEYIYLGHHESYRLLRYFGVQLKCKWGREVMDPFIHAGYLYWNSSVANAFHYTLKSPSYSLNCGKTLVVWIMNCIKYSEAQCKFWRVLHGTNFTSVLNSLQWSMLRNFAKRN